MVFGQKGKDKIEADAENGKSSAHIEEYAGRAFIIKIVFCFETGPGQKARDQNTMTRQESQTD